MKRSISSIYWGARLVFNEYCLKYKAFLLCDLLNYLKTKKIIKAIPSKNGQKLLKSNGWELGPAFKAIWSIILITNSNPIFGWACHAVQWMCSVLAKYPALLWCQGVGEPVQLTDGPGHWVSRQFKGQHIYQLFMSVLTNSINHNISSTQALSPNIQWMVISLSRVTIRYTSKHFWGNWVN